MKYIFPSLLNLSWPCDSGFPDSSVGKESTCNAGDPVRSLGQEDPLEKGMATHSNILAYSIPWTEEPGELHTVQGVAKSWTRLSDFTFTLVSKLSLIHGILRIVGRLAVTAI